MNLGSLKWQFDKYLIMESEQRQKRHSLRFVLIGGILVGCLKATAFFFTNSDAILSDVLESVINMAATGFSLYSLNFAGKPRDQKYPYGKGKIESLAALIEGSLVFIAGSGIAVKAVYNLIYPQGVQGIDMGIVFESAGACINFGLGYYLLSRGKKFDSLVLKADSNRILSDAYSSGALIIGLFIILFTHQHALDSFIAILSGGLIIRTGVKIVRASVPPLLDTADTETLEEVVNLLQENSRPAWIDIQNMRASHYGMYLYIDCHMTLPWYWNLKEVNEQIRDAELLINQHFKERVELFVQGEPCLPKNCPSCLLQDCPVRQAPYRGKHNWKLKEVLQAKEKAETGPSTGYLPPV
jgi:cation diffusion facilitator family transporter